MSKFSPPIPRDFVVSESAHGFHTITVDSYDQFSDLFCEGHFRDYPEYVFRGHRDPSYVTLPTLYRRIIADLHQENASSEEQRLDLLEIAGRRTAAILKHFLFGIRGTQWQEPYHDQIIEWFDAQDGSPHINELRTAAQSVPGLWSSVLNTWSMGQHYGLYTPLLDWSESMLAAFYFAFSQSDERMAGEENREVYALNRKLVDERCRRKDFEQAPLDFVTPFRGSSPRLISQQGLFTYSHVCQSVVEWVQDVFKNDDRPVLIRILIRNVKAQEATRWLSRAGVNDRTIYPDLHGITMYSNRAFDDKHLSFI